MADVWFGLDYGETVADVTTGSSDLSKAVQIVVDDAKIARGEVAADDQILRMVEELKLYILQFDY